MSSPYLWTCDNTRNNHQCTLCSQNNELSHLLIQQKYFPVFLVTHTMSNMNQVMMLVQLFLLSMVKTSGATRDGCDGYYCRGVESYLNCQIYLMKWTVAAYWLIGIGVLIFAFTVSRISYKEKIISFILRLIVIIHQPVKIMLFDCNNLFVCMIQKLFTLLRSCCRTSSRKPARDVNLAWVFK